MFINRRQAIGLIPAAVIGARYAAAQSRAAQASEGPLVAVLKDPGCGCCDQWVEHLKKAGFRATVAESPNMPAVKQKYGVPQSARSCHTGVVAGYVLEGHVPAADVKRLLSERPAVVGLAVPGMPLGSPGMEIPSGRVQPFDTLSFDKTGKTAIFASHR